MPVAPSLDVFYAAAHAVAAAVTTALNTARPNIAFNQADAPANGPRLPVPRIDVFCPGSTPTEQVGFVPNTIPPVPYCSAQRGALSLRLTTRRGDTTTSAALIGLATRVLAIPAQAINASNLPYHEMLMLGDPIVAYSIGEEPETDEHLLTIDFVVGLPPKNYPV